MVSLMSHAGWQIFGKNGLSSGIAEEIINTWDCVNKVAYGI